MTKHLIAPLLLSTFISTPTLAAPEISAREHDDDVVIFSATQDGYVADELLSTDKPIHIKLDHIPLKLDIRAIYQGAVGEDGPWIDVPHTTIIKDWLEIPASQEFDVMIGNADMTPSITWPKNLDCKKNKLLTPPGECLRWSAIYKKCAGAEQGPCYVYQSAFELKVFYDPISAPEIIRINLPGGC